MIRLNYAEPVARTDSANAPRVSDFAVQVVAAAEAEPNCSATAVEMPGPKPPIMIVFRLPLV